LKAAGAYIVRWRADRQGWHWVSVQTRSVLHLQEVDAALVGSRREAGHVADDAATERDEGRAPVQGGPDGSVPHALHLHGMRPHPSGSTQTTHINAQIKRNITSTGSARSSIGS